MAISSITPITASIVAPGDSFSFTVDNTYTTLTIEIDTATGWEYAYDGSLGGAQAGYTVNVEASGGQDIFTVSRAAGWDKDPQVVRVQEDESGSTETTSFSYYLSPTAAFPQGKAPYFSESEGSLLVTADETQVRDDVGWIEFPTADFTVTDMGDGKVKITAVAGSGSINTFVQSFAYEANAAPTTTNWYGYSPSSGTLGWTGNAAALYSWGTGPTNQPYTISPIVPVACKLTRFEVWFRFNSTSIVEEVAIWKFPYTDGAAVGAPVKVATVTVNSTGSSTLNTYDYSVDVTTGNTFDAGDGYMILRKNTSGAAAYFCRAALRFEEL